jgi:tRNA (guanine37-N1)-methyltransferase
MISFEILTIFPQIFQSFLKESLIKKAIEKKLLKIKVYNLRDFTTDKRKTVDDRPYGGGYGMVFKIEPIFRALKKITALKIENLKIKKDKKTKIILLTPRGKMFNQKLAFQLSKLKRIVFICGRYEGVDERVARYLADLQISIGNYDLMGGEVAAMVIIEAVSRLIPGVLGKKELLKERITKEKGFIEYPQYTRPAVFSPKKGVEWKVPKVLLSGNHKKIEEWREKHKKIIE